MKFIVFCIIVEKKNTHTIEFPISAIDDEDSSYFEELLGPTANTEGGGGVISSIIHLTMCNPI